jgi:hypothetical protein
LIWLIKKSNDEEATAAALQAIAGLSRDFSATYILRQAGALRLVEEGFQSCFRLDTAVDLEWHLLDMHAAELYCRAWIKLTRETEEQWSYDIIEPLWLLQELDMYPDVAAIATCAVALSSFDSYTSQWELLRYLEQHSAGDIQLSLETQCCVVDSVIEGMIGWEMPAAVVDETTIRAVPVLLRLLHHTEDRSSSSISGAAALGLCLFTRGLPEMSWMSHHSEEERRARYCEMMVMALSAIVSNPERYGVQDALMDIVSDELCRLATAVVAQSERFPQELKAVAKASLSELFIAGRVGPDRTSEDNMATILHLMFPPPEDIPEHSCALLVAKLVQTIRTTIHPDITIWSIRILEILLTRCALPVIESFANSDGITVTLRAVKTGGVDGQRLQIDGLRTLCSFLDSASTLYVAADDYPRKKLEAHIDLIFSSDFFDTLCSVIASRRSWLFEVSGQWMPTLVKISYIRPHESIWRTIYIVFQKFAERNAGEDGYRETLYHLSVLVRVCGLEKLVQDLGGEYQSPTSSRMSN